MKLPNFPSYAELQAHFRYSPRKGILYKLKTPNDITRVSVITCPVVRYNSMRLSTAQVIWTLVTGEYSEYVMRIDRDPKNNKWSNLKVHLPEQYKKYRTQPIPIKPEPNPSANRSIVIEDTAPITIEELLLELSKPE